MNEFMNDEVTSQDASLDARDELVQIVDDLLDVDGYTPNDVKVIISVGKGLFEAYRAASVIEMVEREDGTHDVSSGQ